MRLALLFILSAAIGSACQAHELWISPDKYQVSVGDPLNAHIRVGETFKGSALSYLERNTARFEIILGNKRLKHEATLGDRPALKRSVPTQGLAVVVHETTDNTLNYKELAKFAKFAKHKDFTGAVALHQARGLPETDFVETYRRFAKSLIAVGNGAGSDRAVGMDTEIVALANPYTDDLSQGMPVRVLLYGKPRANTQVEVFARAPNGTVKTSLFRTNAQGIAVIPMAANTEYQVDAVNLEDRDGTGPRKAVWHTMWANLTFATP